MIIRILKQSLLGPYQLDPNAFKVDKLIGKVDDDLIEEIQCRLDEKINIKPIKKILIDFGPYPLPRSWLVKT